MNASGRLNTCKSRGNRVLAPLTTGARVRNAYRIYLVVRDSPEKFGLIPYSILSEHSLRIKDLLLQDDYAFY